MDRNQDRESPFPRMTVGVMGSAGGAGIRGAPASASARCYHCQKRICSHYRSLPGHPTRGRFGAKEKGGIVVGVSPALNL
jgi:hypothetical protein